MPANLANAAAGLLTRLERLRRCPGVDEVFNMDAIAAALSAASQHAGEASMGLGPVGQSHVPQWFRMASLALDALTLGEHVARCT